MTTTQVESNTMGLSLEIVLNVFLEYFQIWKKKKSEKQSQTILMSPTNNKYK